GASLVKGLTHMLADLANNGGMPSQVDMKAFQVGKDLATSPGAVVFKNEVLELIQFQPTTPEVYGRPLLIVPPQVNKYYVMDLSPNKSLVRYLVANGLQVFTISWRNPTPEDREWGFETYDRAILEAMDVVRAFAWRRPNDLVWNYWGNNYLIGKDPAAFDVLYWNNDTTRLPAQLHGELLDLFETNAFIHPGAFEVLGTPIDLSKVTNDTYIIAGITDHITPSQGCYATTQLLGGKIKFILSNSGHIQAILNPQGNPKASYFMHERYPADPGQWKTGAQQRAGSWWEDWRDWLGQRSGEQKAAPGELGNEQYQ